MFISKEQEMKFWQQIQYLKSTIISEHNEIPYIDMTAILRKIEVNAKVIMEEILNKDVEDKENAQ